jgi:uncharacterized protein with HEPN domain
MIFAVETAKRLHDAVSACEELQQFAAGRTRLEFMEDRALQLVVWKLIEIADEALRQAELAEPDLAQYIPELRDVVNTRNRTTHGYNTVNFNLPWDIVLDDVLPCSSRFAGCSRTPQTSITRQANRVPCITGRDW